jgi:AIPR protein
MSGYQVVNGGQTSHVLFNEKAALDDSVWVPIRVIGSDDEDLTTDVITATNSQTPVAAQELNSRAQFERDLERFFNTFSGGKALYYERRSRQYSDAAEVEKVRIITRDQLVRSVAATFMDEPHRATGYVPLLMEQLNVRIMHPHHKPELYYAAAFAYYKLEFFWRNKQLASKYKPGRFQILMAARTLWLAAR